MRGGGVERRRQSGEAVLAAVQEGGADPGQFLAPSTALRLWARNTMFKTRLVQRLLVSGSTSVAAGLGLPDYPC